MTMESPLQNTPEKRAEARRANRVLLALGTVFFLFTWLPSWGSTYGYFIDELYYLSCADRLDFGYIDHPPLSILVLGLVRSLLGDSLPALRLLPALAGGMEGGVRTCARNATRLAPPPRRTGSCRQTEEHSPGGSRSGSASLVTAVESSTIDPPHPGTLERE